jgi:hypothetical protein
MFDKLKKIFSNWHIIAALLFLFCLAIQMLWLAAFFPGAMTGDSISMWKQSAVGFGYYNLQPYFYTALLYHLREIWNSPALVAILQIVVSAALASGFSVFLLRKQANKWLVVGGYLAFVFSIPVMITNTIIHRDASYAALVLLLSIIFVTLFFHEKDETSTTKLVFLGLLLALIASMRYDGAIYLLFAPFLLYIFKLLNKKSILIVFLAGLIGYFVVQVPLGSILQIKENRFLQVYDLETEFIGQIYHDHPETFSTNDIALMTKLTPLKAWQNFDPTDDFTYWEKYKIGNFYSKDFREEWDRMFLKKFWANPVSIIKDRYYMTLGLTRGEKINGPDITANDLGIIQEPLIAPSVRDSFDHYFSLLYKNEFTRFLIWSPFFLLVDAIFLTLAIIKKKKHLIAYILIGLASFVVIIPIVTSGQFRYSYPLYYSSFFVPALYTIKLAKDKKKLGFYSK